MAAAPRQSRPDLHLIKALLSHILPKADEHEIERILASRNAASAEDEVCQSVLNDPNIDDALGKCVDECDHSEFKRIIATMKVPSTWAKPKPAASASSAASGSAPERWSTARLRPKRFPDARSCTPAWARQFVPQTPGASVVIDEVRHMRWVAEYRNKKGPPRSHSATFGDESCVTRRKPYVGSGWCTLPGRARGAIGTFPLEWDMSSAHCHFVRVLGHRFQRGQRSRAYSRRHACAHHVHACLFQPHNRRPLLRGVAGRIVLATDIPRSRSSYPHRQRPRVHGIGHGLGILLS